MGKHSSAFRRMLIIYIFFPCAVSNHPVNRASVKPPGTTTNGSGFPQDRANAKARSPIGECMGAAGDQGEFDMDSESNRRILTTIKYISYGVLERDFLPCSIKGTSYYNCVLGGQANPYTRGCSAITNCRS